MTTITIPRTFNGNDDLVALPRKEYEELVQFRTAFSSYTPTVSERQALRRSRIHMKAGHSHTLEQFCHEVGLKNRRSNK